MLVLGLLAGPSLARAADPPPPAEVQALTRQAIEAYRAGRYRVALQSLLRVAKASPRPAVHFVIARCHEELGQLQEARRAFQRFLASDVQGEDRVRGQRRLRAIEQRLALRRAELLVRLRPPSAEVTIGGKTYRGPGPIRVELRPGRYRLEARADGHTPRSREVTVAPGTRWEVELTLTPIPVAPAPPPSPSPGGGLTGRELAGWVLTGVGSAGVLAAVGLTVASLDAHADAEPTDADGDGRADGPLEDARAANERGNALGVGAIVSYAVGGALIATGVALVLTADGVEVQGALLPVPGGAVLGLGGRF